jgi:hypothetical protein
MDHDIDGQHREHFPIPDMRISVLCNGVEHHETTDEETYNDCQFGIAYLLTIIRLRDFYEHQKQRQNPRAYSYNQLHQGIDIDIDGNHLLYAHL